MRARALLCIGIGIGCSLPDSDHEAIKLSDTVDGAEGAVPLGCELVFDTGSPVVAWTDAVDVCLEPDGPELNPDAPLRIYDSCQSQGWTPGACEPLPFGSQICENGRWTVLCAGDSDCPPETKCSWGVGVGSKPASVQFGTCEKTCAGAGGGECRRCDLTCNVALGVCESGSPEQPPAVPCRADCDCDEGSCVAGFCDPYASSPRLGICESHGGDCSCTGGTCDDRGCCQLPDGTVDTGFGAGCLP